MKAVLYVVGHGNGYFFELSSEVQNLEINFKAHGLNLSSATCTQNLIFFDHIDFLTVDIFQRKGFFAVDSEQLAELVYVDRVVTGVNSDVVSCLVSEQFRVEKNASTFLELVESSGRV